MASEFIVGMMSGTSADGIDAALVEFKTRRRLQVYATRFTPFNNEIQDRINEFAHGNEATYEQPGARLLGQDLAELYARAAIQLIAGSGLDPSNISLIANHGQTVAHRPNANPPVSVQLGESQSLANLTGLPVVSQFRQGDLAKGGQGAPLMPAFHEALLSSKSNEAVPQGDVFVLNLGGIANITAVSKNLGDNVVGFDTGPANTLLNQWIKSVRGLNYDANGSWAAGGSVIEPLLQACLNDPYFKQPYPKSTGPDYFNLAWLQERTKQALESYPPTDVQTTLAALTVESIKLGLDQLGADKGTIFVCGGGANNRYLMQELAEALPSLDVKTTASLGVPPDWVEAAGFAWLGFCHLRGIKSNLPSVTGARKKVVLGQRWEPVT